MTTRSNATVRTRSKKRNIGNKANNQQVVQSQKKRAVPKKPKRKADEFEVESILDRRVEVEDGVEVEKFLVSWVGYDEHTWEPRVNLKAATITAYLAKLPSPTTSAEPVSSQTIGDAIADNKSRRSSQRKRTVSSTSQADAEDLSTAQDQPPSLGDTPVLPPPPSAAIVDGADCSTAQDRPAILGDAPVQPLLNRPIDRRADTNVAADSCIGASTALIDVRVVDPEDDETEVFEDVVSDTGDLYEVEGIHGIRNHVVDGVDIEKCLVAWFGYDDRSWEPSRDLPQDMVEAYRQSSLANDQGLSSPQDASSLPADNPVEVCATCGDNSGGLGSACAVCRNPMHHFCATDVCAALKLKDSDGKLLDEFPNDVSYCSSICYSRRLGTVAAGKKKRARSTRTATDDDETDYDDEYVETTASSKRKKSTNDAKPKGKSVPALVKVRTQTKTRVRAGRSVSTTASGVGTFAGDEESVWPPRKPKAVAPAPRPVTEPQSRDPLVGRIVAFCAEKEDWMPAKLYKAVKGLYLSGRIFLQKRVVGERLSEPAYEVRWTVTNYQSKAFFHRLTKAKIEEGIQNYATIKGGVLNKASWRHICKVPDKEACSDNEDLEDFVILDGDSDLFVSQQVVPENLEVVEQISSLDFQPERRMCEPPDLFVHEDGTQKTKVLKEKSHHFTTASSSFFAYLPISFWKAVVSETNEYGSPLKPAAISLDEMMRFFGMLFYMTVVKKGAYSNYWGSQAEDEIMKRLSPASSADGTRQDSRSGFRFELLMTKKRFQHIRSSLSFRSSVSPAEIKKDPAARIRPLINMLKYTSTKYVALGRNVSVDESSVACRSKQTPCCGRG